MVLSGAGVERERIKNMSDKPPALMVGVGLRKNSQCLQLRSGSVFLRLTNTGIDLDSHIVLL